VTNPDNPEKPRLSRESKEEALRRILTKHGGADGEMNGAQLQAPAGVPEAHYRIDKFADYQALTLQRDLAKKVDLESPYFLEHDRLARDTAMIGGREYINFGTYN